MTVLVVDRLDHNGGGVALSPDGLRTIIPGALPGETLQLTDTEPLYFSRSDHRTEPPCPLFGDCGSCSAQHMSSELYGSWKSGLVRTAFRDAGLTDIPLSALRRAPLASRRRVTLTVADGKVGYHRRASHDLLDVRACPALDPALAKALPAIRATAQNLAAGGTLRLTATLVENGIDLAATRPPAPKPTRKSGPRKRRGRARRPAPPPDLLPAGNIVRITLDSDVVLQREDPVVRLGGALVPFPPSAFLQASQAGERFLTDAVLEPLADAHSVVDLFCGLGTFTLPLARTAKVLAVENGAAPLAALASAASQAHGRKPITTLRRDLIRDPMAPSEFAGHDSVIFDPPRAGALAQAKALAKSHVPLLVAVSCNPKTLARDCAILIDAGYKITQVVPVDQFVATAHIEVVATLRRE
ncbi:MAG: hypothetical protein AAF580_12250 [Pseudomonadota bacterium]